MCLHNSPKEDKYTTYIDDEKISTITSLGKIVYIEA